MAIPKHISLEFVTPERLVVHDDVDEVELPGLEGYLGVLPGHAPLLTTLKPGEMWYRKGADKRYAFVGGGFAEIVGDRVSILARVAERAEDIDAARAEAAKRRAEERLAKSGTTELDAERARTSLLRANVRLQVARHTRMRG
jgi:F-type H+-transporting ATPase subunit epsilon